MDQLLEKMVLSGEPLKDIIDRMQVLGLEKKIQDVILVLIEDNYNMNMRTCENCNKRVLKEQLDRRFRETICLVCGASQ